MLLLAKNELNTVKVFISKVLIVLIMECYENIIYYDNILR